MTKVEYMEKLQERLQIFDAELQEEILEDYKQHFAEGEAFGKTEEELIAELGEIEDMIAELEAAVGGRGGQYAHESRKAEENVVNGVAASADGKSVSAGRAAVSGTAEFTLAEQVGMENGEKGFLRKISECRDREQPEWVREMNLLISGNCTGLELDGQVADIVVEASPDENVSICLKDDSEEWRYGMGYGRSADRGDGPLWVGFIDLKKNGSTRDGGRYRGRGILGKHLNGEILEKNQELCMHVKLPKNFPEIIIHGTSGEVQMKDLDLKVLSVNGARGDTHLENTRVTAMDCTTASGDIVLKNVEVQNCECNTASGDVWMEKLQTKLLNVATASGDVQMEHVQGDALEIGTASGDVVCDNLAGRVLNIETASGDIACRNLQGNVLSLGTSSGDIAVEANCKKVSLGTANGEVTAKVAGAEEVELETGSGDGCLQLRDVKGVEGSFEIEGSGRIEVINGSTKIQVCGSSGRTNQINFGEGACKLQVITGSGELKVVLE